MIGSYTLYPEDRNQPPKLDDMLYRKYLVVVCSPAQPDQVQAAIGDVRLPPMCKGGITMLKARFMHERNLVMLFVSSGTQNIHEDRRRLPLNRFVGAGLRY